MQKCKCFHSTERESFVSIIIIVNFTELSLYLPSSNFVLTWVKASNNDLHVFDVYWKSKLAILLILSAEGISVHIHHTL
jgi:hypothetical protein